MISETNGCRPRQAINCNFVTYIRIILILILIKLLNFSFRLFVMFCAFDFFWLAWYWCDIMSSLALTYSISHKHFRKKNCQQNQNFTIYNKLQITKERNARNHNIAKPYSCSLLEFWNRINYYTKANIYVS